MKHPEPEPPNSQVVRHLRIAPRRGGVRPLTDAEILALRQMLEQFDAIRKTCPLARRALSER
jgi:hypothetical protein